MKNILFNVLIVSALALVSLGCGGQPPVAQGKPKWTLLPPNDGHVYGVGESAIHVSGKTFQRSLAISRGIDEIARQKGVKVSNSLERVQQVSNGGSSQSARNYSIQTVDGQVVKAVIHDVYEDPYNKRLYVLMKEQ